MNQSKPCKKCGQTKSLIDFHKNPLTKDGHKNSCKQCESLHYKNYREQKPRIVGKEQQKRWTQNRVANTPIEELRRASAKWYHNNKEKHKAHRKNYLAKNPGLNASYVRKYEAMRRGNGVFAISKKEIRRLRLSACFYCGQKKEVMTIDHVISLKRGGTHSIGNLVSACRSCNSSKQDKFITEWHRAKGVKNAAY